MFENINIKMILLFILIVIPNFVYGYGYKTFSTKGIPESHGINITVKYPEFYDSHQGSRQEVVRRFNYKDDNIINSMLIMVRDIGKKYYNEMINVSESRLVNDLKNYCESGGIDIKNIYSDKIQGEKAVVVEGSSIQNTVNSRVYLKLIHSVIFYEGKVIDLQCSSASAIKDSSSIKSSVDNVNKYSNNTGKKICLDYINSVNFE